MEWRRITRHKLRAQILEKLIGGFERVAGPCEKCRFVTAGLAYEKITRQFLASDYCIGRQFHRLSLYQRDAEYTDA
jgi:hypothetical protein